MSAFDQDGLHETFAETLPGAAFFFEIDAAQTEKIRFLNSGCEQIWAVSAKTLSIWEARFRITDARGAQKYLLSRGRPTRLPNGGRP
ncbi:hypothetical protein So717_36710 [Roseobacter cerasinus]|uniref:Uncharacterized protein n=1 Tax=Roseobacter cerasinus TaxID=2602289 RepID=A0A640VU50_9RHOB|nr:hypothetical protein [Roseobacter cerasinus]GFE51918.1 hypothetical protein So717_36710 [Roseobacter cerasinus]